MKKVAPARFMRGREMDTWQKKKGRSFFNSSCSQVVPANCSWTKFQLLFLSLDQLILNIKNPFQSTRPTRENPREQIVGLREQHWACFFERERTHVDWVHPTTFSLLFPSHHFHTYEKWFYPSPLSTYWGLIVVRGGNH